MKEELEVFLNKNNMRYKIHDTTNKVDTIDSAAKALDIQSENIIKSLIFLVDDEPYVIIGIGKKTINLEKIKDLLEADNVEMATPSVVKKITGYSIGEVPPLSLDLPKIIEKSILEKKKVYGGGGSENRILEIEPTYLLDDKTIVSSIQDK